MARSNSRICPALLLSAMVSFLASEAGAQVRGRQVIAGVAAGLIMGVLVANQRAIATPRYRSARQPHRVRSASSRSSPQTQSRGAIRTSGSDPFSGVAATRLVSD